MLDEQIFQNPNWLFISFEQGGGGHKLGRVLAALPEVYWYSDEHNGKHPWNVLTQGHIRQRNVSKYHWNRYAPLGKLPPTYDFVQDYVPDRDEYYATTFTEKFTEYDGLSLLNNYLLPYCTHMLPNELLVEFPNARIINIISDVEHCASRYMDVTLEFPGAVKHLGVLPQDNEHVQWLRALEKQKPDLTAKDVLTMKKYGTFWDDSRYTEFYVEAIQNFENRMEERSNVNHPQVLNVYNTRNYKLIKEFLLNKKPA